MTKFVLSRPGAPWDYPTLGFTATADGAILDGTLFDPDLTIPPDAYWSVYGGGSAETSITRYATPLEEYLDPTPEVTEGYLLAYSDADNTYVPTSPDDVIATAAWDTTLTAAIGGSKNNAGSITQHRYDGDATTEPGAFIAWTADDGYTSFVDYFALLDTKGISGTLFLTEQWVDKVGSDPTWSDTYITQAQVQTIADNGHELGTHGVNHEAAADYLASNGAAALHALEAQVKAYIETTFDVAVRTGAYPAGQSNARVREIVARTHDYFRGTKGAVSYNASDPFDVPAIDVQALTEAAIKAYVDDAVANNSMVTFLIHGMSAGTKAAVLTKLGNVIDYATGLGVRQGTFYQGMSERTVTRGSAGHMVDSQGNAYFRTVKATRLVTQRDDGLFGRAWLDIDETASNPQFDADGGAAFEFLKPLRAVSTLQVGQRRVFTDGVTTNLSTTLTSASAAFDQADVGRTITGTGIPGSTTIAAYVSGTQVTLSAAATATATGVTITIGRPTTSSLVAAGTASFYSTLAVHSASNPTVAFRDLAGTDLGGISSTTWNRAGSGGAMSQDSGSGGSVFTMRNFALRLLDHTGSNAVNIKNGTGTPEGAYAAPVGSIFLRTDGGAGTSFYVKETGAATNTGWVAK